MLRLDPFFGRSGSDKLGRYDLLFAFPQRKFVKETLRDESFLATIDVLLPRAIRSSASLRIPAALIHNHATDEVHVIAESDRPGSRTSIGWKATTQYMARSRAVSMAQVPQDLLRG